MNDLNTHFEVLKTDIINAIKCAILNGKSVGEYWNWTFDGNNKFNPYNANNAKPNPLLIFIQQSPKNDGKTSGINALLEKICPHLNSSYVINCAYYGFRQANKSSVTEPYYPLYEWFKELGDQLNKGCWYCRYG